MTVSIHGPGRATTIRQCCFFFALCQLSEQCFTRIINVISWLWMVNAKTERAEGIAELQQPRLPVVVGTFLVATAW